MRRTLRRGCDDQNVRMRVRDPSGGEWSIRRQWLPRYQGRGLRTRLRARHDRRKAQSTRTHWYDNLDIPILDSLDELFVVVLVVIAVVLLIVFGIPLLFAVFDVVFVILVTVVGVVSRVMFRRPWTIEVTGPDGETTQHPVVGWRASGRLIDVLAAGVRAGDRH